MSHTRFLCSNPIRAQSKDLLLQHALEGVLQQLFSAIDGKVGKIPIVIWSMPDYNVSLAACLAILLQFYSLQGMYYK